MKPLPLKLLQFLLFLTSIASLCLPAIINGYPLANPDTGTYLESGFIPQVPTDRPINYGILVRLFSLNGISLWFTIIFQAILINYIIRTTVKISTDENTQIAAHIITIILALMSTVSWITSELIADVYTPIMILCIACIATYSIEKKAPIELYVLLFIATATHTSHLAISLSIFLLLWLFRKQIHEQTARPKHLRRLLTMAAVCVATYGINASVYSKSSAAFMTAAIINKGILTKYLDATCAIEKIEFCKYKDDISTNSDIFLWSSDSPLAKMGGWIDARDECREINSAILLTYPYNLQFFQKSFEHTSIQLLEFNVGDGNYPLADNRGVCKSIKKIYISKRGKDVFTIETKFKSTNPLFLFN